MKNGVPILCSLTAAAPTAPPVTVSVTVRDLRPNPATNIPISLASQGVNDIQVFGHTYPTCLADNENQTLDMSWTVRVGSVTYSITTVVGPGGRYIREYLGIRRIAIEVRIARLVRDLEQKVLVNSANICAGGASIEEVSSTVN